MASLLCFGLGYSAERFIRRYSSRFAPVVATVRGAERAAALTAQHGGRLTMFAFDGKSASAGVTRAIEETDAMLISIPQTEEGDPVQSACGEALKRARRLKSIVYLSTVGIYGDHGGAWVDENCEPQPDSERGQKRLAAERAWQDFGVRSGVAVAILRLAGIYGPGRNALVQLEQGTARRIVKPGQVFNRIHVVDIAQAIEAAFTRKVRGIFNVADDEPSPPGDPIVFAAKLLGREPPPEIPFADAAPSMSPLALSFWQACRRVRNDKLKNELGVTLDYPTYREGLRALFEAGEGARV